MSTGVPVHSATRRRSSGPETFTVSRGIGEDGVKLKPYCAGFLAMTIAARIIGTYSRVSRGSQRLLELSSQKSSLPVRFIARCTRPGPPLYDASARCQSPSKMRLSVFRYFAAAFVAFSGSDRSSMYQSCLRPFSSAVARTNCQTPRGSSPTARWS